jgi:hypothetical protein
MSYHGFRSLAEPSLDVIMDGEFDCPNQTGILLRGAYGVSNEHHAGEPNHSIALVRNQKSDVSKSNGNVTDRRFQR